eukprot:8458198-Pyramimonas_sp.AAC.1
MVSMRLARRAPSLKPPKCRSSLRYDKLPTPRCIPSPPWCALACCPCLCCMLASRSWRSWCGVSASGKPVSCVVSNSQVSPLSGSAGGSRYFFGSM